MGMEETSTTLEIYTILLPAQQRAAVEKLANEIGGRHEETRTPDLYRVNFEVNNLKPFACLAFPLSLACKNAIKRPSFGDELVTSFPMLC
jgi:hypothetical protein